MPYFHLAGPANDPEEHAHKFYSFSAKEVFSMNVKTGLQRGPISIYMIKPHEY